ncbi:hypothetical protein [Reticulibacter mediterranei]|uniref:hypothetical protein n=1 Tax=Reticulibacter mediterranei TaxID=2778369 RepID=UPI001C68B7B2|nr:hypothetical protein [Reticulibacter mediterranei]
MNAYHCVQIVSLFYDGSVVQFVGAPLMMQVALDTGNKRFKLSMANFLNMSSVGLSASSLPYERLAGCCILNMTKIVSPPFLLMMDS